MTLQGRTACVFLFLALSACTTVRQVKDPLSIPVNAPAQVQQGDGTLAYMVAVSIQAPPDKVWPLLASTQEMTRWNSTLVSIQGNVVQGGKVELVAKSSPDRTFSLSVTELVPQQKLVWEDGMPMGLFAGVRTYTLHPSADGASTIFTMSEVISGPMLKLIGGSLPGFRADFDKVAADLKKAAETAAGMAPTSFILLDWQDGRVRSIRDFRYVPDVVDGADVVAAE